jgi:hypothetical protein
MSAAQVLTPARSGIYRTPLHVDALKPALGEDHSWIDLNLSHVGSKAELLDLFARELGFPPAFGRNWDALADALRDLSWRPAQCYVIRLADAARASQALGADWAAFIEVLRLAASYWKAREIVFVAFVDDAAGLPLWI